MGTKNNPGEYDCYANAEPDEPMFILLGRDPASFLALAMWIGARITVMGEDHHDPKLEEAMRLLEEMKAWAVSKGKGAIVKKMSKAVEDLGSIWGWHLENDGLYLSPGHPFTTLRAGTPSRLPMPAVPPHTRQAERGGHLPPQALPGSAQSGGGAGGP